MMKGKRINNQSQINLFSRQPIDILLFAFN
jgi:hypothetical protein